MPVSAHQEYSSATKNDYSDATWASWRSKSPATRLCVYQIDQANIKNHQRSVLLANEKPNNASFHVVTSSWRLIKMGPFTDRN